MVPDKYDAVFVGGGLAATLLLNELRPTLPTRVAVVESWSPLERPPVHWSYWSREPTLYDQFAVGTWRRAGVAETLPESIAPFALRLVRSSDVFRFMAASRGFAVQVLNHVGVGLAFAFSWTSLIPDADHTTIHRFGRQMKI